MELSGFTRSVVQALDSADNASVVTAVLLEAAERLLPRASQPAGASSAAHPVLSVAPAVAAASELLRTACAGQDVPRAFAADTAAFSLLADALLLGVLPDWLPSLPPVCASICDALLRCAHAEAALEALAKRGGSEQAVARAAAQRHLCARFLDPGSRGISELSEVVASGDKGSRGAARAQAAASLLLSLPERAAQRLSDAQPLLRSPPLFYAALARRCAECVALQPGHAPFCCQLWARCTRRGGAPQLAASAVSLVLEEAAQPALGAAARTLASLLTKEDRWACERLAEESLLLLSALPAASAGSLAARCAALTRLLSLDECDEGSLTSGSLYAHLLTDRLLLRRPLPRRALQLLLTLSLPPATDSPLPPPPPAALASAQLAPLLLHSLVSSWTGPHFAAGGAETQQFYLAGAMCAVLVGPPGAEAGDWLGRLQSIHPQLCPSLLKSIAVRLGAPVPTVRLCGMRVASAFSTALRLQALAAAAAAAAPPVLFQAEAEAPPEPGDLWGADLWTWTEEEAGSENGAALQAVADAAEAAKLAATAPGPAAPANAAVELDIDPDAPFDPQGGAWRAASAAAAAAGGAFDSDDESSGSSLSAYEMSDTEDPGGGPDAPLPTPAAPTSLRRLLEMLRGGSGNTGEALSSSGESGGGPAAAQAALKAAENLILAATGLPELPLFAAQLSIALLGSAEAEQHCSEDAEDDAKKKGRPPPPAAAAPMRRSALAALLCACPAEAGGSLTAHFAAAALDVGTRLELLDCIALAAEQMAGLSAAPKPSEPTQLLASSGLAPPTPAPAAEPAAEAERGGVSRRFAPVSLRRMKEGPKPTRVNAFGPAARVIAMPLLACAAAALRAEEARGASAEPAAGLVLGRLLVTLGVSCSCCQRTPAAAELPPQVLRMLAGGLGGGEGRPATAHAEPYVRRTAHYAAAAALQALPPALLAGALEDGSGSSLLEWIEGVCALASAAAERDPDAEARGLAGAVLFARKRLGEETEEVARALPVPELLMSAKLTTRVPKLDIRL